MILAGIDEAGLGPALGPLCVCASVLRVPDGSDANVPWEILDPAVARTARKKNVPLLVTDSKIAYNARGVSGLELAVLSFLQAIGRTGKLPHARLELLRILGDTEIITELPRCPWDAEDEWPVPGHLAEAALEGGIAALNGTLVARESLEILGMRALVRMPWQLNKLFGRGLNKSEALMLQTGTHLRAIHEQYAGEEILVVIDKQGGRNFYAPFLIDLFDGAWISTTHEAPDYSEYQLGNTRIIFRAKADAEAFPVALASMLAKYLRERFMESFNRFFCARVSGLAPTAGYHGDAPRFMNAIRPLFPRLGVTNMHVWRER